METRLLTIEEFRAADIFGGRIASYPTPVSRAAMKRALGTPHEEGGEKTTAIWYLRTPFGLAWLYDWKQIDVPDDESIHWEIGADYAEGDLEEIRGPACVAAFVADALRRKVT